MATTDNSHYSASQLQLAQLHKALAHPARVAIIQHLIKVQNCVCGDIVEEIGLAQATISQHLKALKLAGLIKGNVEGASVCYCIDQENWIAMKSLMNLFLDQESISTTDGINEIIKNKECC
jgi:DNA-binding transcriptional ArsR family regulator